MHFCCLIYLFDTLVFLPAQQINAILNSTPRISVGVLKTVLTLFFLRSLSSYHASQYDKESYATRRLEQPEAYKQRLVRNKAYYDRVRQDSVSRDLWLALQASDGSITVPREDI